MKNEHNLPCPINWDKVPKYVKYVAVSKDGEVRIFEKKPIIIDNRIWGYPYSQSFGGPHFPRIRRLKFVFPPADFTLCLWKRPENENPC